jgi:hypothetical protein
VVIEYQKRGFKEEKKGKSKSKSKEVGGGAHFVNE